jgi:hypothetical protein
MKKLISWVEIPANNFGRATAFYENLLQLKLEVFESETEKMACFPGGEGAISQAPGFAPGQDGVMVSFNVSDEIQSSLRRVEEQGGKVLIPKTKIEAEGRGYFAVFIDCEGNKVGLYGAH